MSLITAAKKIYPQLAKGRFRKIKNILNVVFLSIYLFTPFLRFDRGENASNQAVLIDIADSKGYFFFIEIWPQEVFYLAAILIIAALGLFFITSLFGRIWCGYGCFQTVWTDIFIAIERFFQGDRNQRILLDRKNNLTKLVKKIATHICWIIFSLITGFSFAAYFNDIYLLIENLINFSLNLSQIFWILLISAMTYLMAGFAREQVCFLMCPYAKFQSAMFDDNSLIISYDEKRGEPRGKFSSKFSEIKSETQNQTSELLPLTENKIAGDCIDCKQCLVVCPVGIDIRNGLQMECIACGLCIDACDEVMIKINKPTGLIRYDTEKNIQNPKKENRFKILRARTIWYSSILLITISTTAFSLINKKIMQVSIIANRNPAFILMTDDSIRNSYQLRIVNKSHQIMKLKILLSDQDKENFSLKINDNSQDLIEVKADSVKTLNFFITTNSQYFENQPSENLSQRLVRIKIEDQISDIKLQETAVFILP